MKGIMKTNADGDKMWYTDLECTDLIYIEREWGTKEWYKNNDFHRDGDLPAIIYNNGTKKWYRNGYIHRDNDLPAVETSRGDKMWYKNGVIHRDNDLPAIEYFGGDKMWIINGLFHRENDLPAIIRADGSMEWFREGYKYYPDRWTTHPLLNDMPGKTCVITMETIMNDSEVCKCDVCSAVMLHSALQQWLEINEACPHCRSQWNSWTKYKSN